MENQPATPAPVEDQELDSNLNGVFEEFSKSMTAMQMQDLNTSEQSLLRARNYYRSMSVKLTDDDLAPVRVIVNAIDVITRVLRSAYLGMSERYKKALEELAVAETLCDETGSYFSALGAPNVGGVAESNEGWEIFRFYFIFFDCIISASRTQYQSMVDAAAGKFVDDAEVLQETIRQLRRINDYSFPHDKDNFGMAMVNLVNKMADLNEQKLEKEQEKRERIDFMRPIGRKVFIVHGHDESILAELKDILKTTFNLEPIILKELKDDGRTVIEKFEDNARLCAFAFVIVTPDDTVETKDGKYFQGRPNVLFELGWFSGRFGRDKMRILRQRDVQLPSDLSGLITIDFKEKLSEVVGRISNDLASYGILVKKEGS